MDSGYEDRPKMFVGTLPQVTPWNYLHPRGSNHSVMSIRIWENIPSQATKDGIYEVDLTEYYNYCKVSNINILGHTLDRVNHNQKCLVSFYFASITDKAHFILKYK